MTSYAIICSNLDSASVNIRKSLIEEFDFKETDVVFDNENVYSNGNIKLYTLNKELVYCENLDERINADFFIFASKHQSKTQIPSLTVHSIGNWGKAELGGRDCTLVHSSALLQRDLFINLQRNMLNFDVVNEATHHGPYLDKLGIFIEIGSSTGEWNNKDAGKIVAETIIDTIKSKRKKIEVAVGIGGLHTCTNFNKIISNGYVSIAHFCPKYALEFLNKEMINEAIKKTIEKVDFLLLDWKGLKSEKERIISIIKDIGIDYRKTNEF